MSEEFRPFFRARRRRLFDLLATALALSLIVGLSAATLHIRAGEPGTTAAISVLTTK